MYLWHELIASRRSLNHTLLIDLCKPFHLNDIDDGLNEMVTALAPKFTSRFGEIVWAQGGVGFGWWPACIYDPRLTQGGARQLAKRNVGKKHLVYFFECHDAPFAVMGDSKLCQWEEGLMGKLLPWKGIE